LKITDAFIKLFILLFITSILYSEEFLATDELKRGMILDSHTRMSGNEMVDFKLEVLSVMENSSPGEDSIMAEIKDELFQETGVLAGMSGSPVYYQGKLIGAVAYTTSFLKKPIVGITPIHSMLRLIDYDKVKKKERYGSGKSFYGMKKISTPLVINGNLHMNRSMLSSMLKQMEDNEFLLIPGGVSTDPEIPTNFKSGDACGINFVRGDLNISAFGTVTYVSNDYVLAFGHPMDMSGPVDVPLYTAVIDAVVPRLSISYKLGKLGNEVGVITEDRSSAVLGKLGDTAERIPVNVSLKTEVQEKKLHYEIIDDPNYFNMFAPVVILNSFFHYESLAEESTVAYSMEIHTDYKDKVIEVYDTVSVPDNTSSMMGVVESLKGILSYLQFNNFLPIKIKKIDISIDLENYINFSYIDDIQVQKKEYCPGDTVRVRVKLKKYKSAPTQTNFYFKIPEDASDGLYPLIVSSGYYYLFYDSMLTPDKYVPETPAYNTGILIPANCYHYRMKGA